VASKTHGERIDKLEQLIADLATETRHGFDLVKKQFEASVKEADKRARQTDERMKRTDERTDKLVVAIGEFISRSK
jgi:ElaB/YqjD/DUF883 family membrane-anchored ribosome-binding protein